MKRSEWIQLGAIMALSLALNFWGIGFGLPEGWHPDEVVDDAADMVRNQTLNPHLYAYGTMHFNVVLAVSALPYLISNLASADFLTQKTVVYLAARSLSALMGTGSVVLTFLLGRLLFSATCGLIAALFLTLSMGFVNIAHFATVDMPMLFWMLLSFLMAGLVLRAGDRRYYVAAGLFAGFAAATKYVGGIALLTLVASHLLQTERRDHLGLLWGVLASAAAFIATNPALLLWSCEFFEGFVIDNAYNTTLGGNSNAAPLVRPGVQLYYILGPALSILVGAALIYGTRLLFHRESRRSIALIGSMFVPFLLLITNLPAANMRHVLPLAPPLLLLVGKMMADLVTAQGLRQRLGYGLLAVAVLFSALCTLSAELQFTFDARNLATNWISEHVAPGSKIEVTPYSPRISDERYVVEERPRLRNLDSGIASLEEASLYRVLHPIYLRYQSVAESVGLCEPRERHYVSWFEEAKARASAALVHFDPSIEGLEARAPDLLVVSSLWYDRFIDDPTGPDGHFFKQLFEGGGSYRQVAEFHYELLPWLNPAVEFINPTVRVFQKQTAEP